MHNPDLPLEETIKKLRFRQLMESFYNMEYTNRHPIVFMTGKKGLDLFNKFITNEFNKL